MMQAIALRPQRRQLTGMLAGLGALTAAMLAFPALCLPLGLLLPLFACPLVGTSRQWAAYAAPFVPPVTALAFGAPTLYAASLVFLCGAPVAAALLLRPRKGATPVAFGYYIAAYGLGTGMALAGALSVLGGSLTLGVADLLTESVVHAPNAGQILYQLAAAGVISMPPGYQLGGLLAYMVDPLLASQLVMSLQLTLRTAAQRLLPLLIVQACLLGGVFTTLRCQRLNHSYLLVDQQHREQVKLAVTPGFSMLELPRGGNLALMALGLAGLVLWTAGGSYCQTLSLLFMAAFEAAFELLGASAAVGLLARKHPQAKTAFGLLAAALYLLAPSALLLIGILDSVLHLRSREPFQTKKEDGQ